MDLGSVHEAQNRALVAVKLLILAKEPVCVELWVEPPAQHASLCACAEDRNLSLAVLAARAHDAHAFNPVGVRAKHPRGRAGVVLHTTSCRDVVTPTTVSVPGTWSSFCTAKSSKHAVSLMYCVTLMGVEGSKAMMRRPLPVSQLLSASKATEQMAPAWHPSKRTRVSLGRSESKRQMDLSYPTENTLPASDTHTPRTMSPWHLTAVWRRSTLC